MKSPWKFDGLQISVLFIGRYFFHNSGHWVMGVGHYGLWFGSISVLWGQFISDVKGTRAMFIVQVICVWKIVCWFTYPGHLPNSFRLFVRRTASREQVVRVSSTAQYLGGVEGARRWDVVSDHKVKMDPNYIPFCVQQTSFISHQVKGFQELHYKKGISRGTLHNVHEDS